jgi:hypothetical protein
MEQGPRKPSMGERWSNARASKTVVFWSCAASIVVTMIVGFSWGGWVTSGTAQRNSDVKVEEAVAGRLTPFCVVQVNQDPKKAQKLKELKEISTWEQGEYVKKQGWATMPGEREPESSIAAACVKLISQ